MSPSTLPEGDPVPADGSLPAESLALVPGQPLSIYLHIPFCRTRCGYCDFNTYTASELGDAPGASRDSYLHGVLAELDLARRALGADTPPVGTIFIGGGTPTLLPAQDLVAMIAGIEERFGLAPDCEVTTESNPDTVDLGYLESLRGGGFNRISFGMQSSSTRVLKVLDREHTPGRAVDSVRLARQAGFDDISLDLIYGTPGETMGEWTGSLTAALSAEPDHISAYSLIVEDGTRLAARIRRGELAMTDEDDLADKYLAAEEILTGHGLAAYEVSNWARPGTGGADHRCRHNLAYWKGHNWWGIGPGAHSHVGGTRFWNVKHPAAYAGRLQRGESPAYAREVLDAQTRRIEKVMLELRLDDGLDPAVLTGAERSRVPALIERGLVHDGPGPLRLTLQGRLLADGVVRDLLD